MVEEGISTEQYFKDILRLKEKQQTMASIFGPNVPDNLSQLQIDNINKIVEDKMDIKQHIGKIGELLFEIAFAMDRVYYNKEMKESQTGGLLSKYTDLLLHYTIEFMSLLRDYRNFTISRSITTTKMMEDMGFNQETMEKLIKQAESQSFKEFIR